VSFSRRARRLAVVSSDIFSDTAIGSAEETRSARRAGSSADCTISPSSAERLGWIATSRWN